MPTNEKSEKKHQNCWCVRNGKPHVYLHGATPDKLAEAKKLVENFHFHKRLRDEQEFNGAEEHEHNCEMVALLLRSQDLISYEKGREDQRKADAEIVKRFSNGCGCSEYCRNRCEFSIEAQQKILNPPSPDAK